MLKDGKLCNDVRIYCVRFVSIRFDCLIDLIEIPEISKFVTRSRCSNSTQLNSP